MRPLISEKSLGLASRGWYTFAVGKHARKEEIAKLIAHMYSVSVLSVRTIAMHGKMRRSGKKMVRKQKEDWKKAIVQLKAGQHIDAFEVTQKEAPVEKK
jgi:ribosomal protein L23